MDDGKKRVLVVDDSVFARKIVSDILNSSPDLEVVGIATNGGEALSMVEKLKPDVVTLDIEMPVLDGIETLKRLMQTYPVPVVMVSSLTDSGTRECMQALRIGAIDVIAKPYGTHSIGLTAQSKELIAKVLAAAYVDMSHVKPVIQPKPHHTSQHIICKSAAFPIVIIASSTGGPRALRALVPDLTTIAGAAYVIVQHLPEGFSGPLAQDLNNMTELDVREATDGDSLSPGDLIFAKAGYHTVFTNHCEIRLTRDAPLWGVRPSADVTMLSAVPVYGSRLIGVILTGMGRDGADGLRLIKEAGGKTLAEHESSCVVYGMPRAAIESGVVDVIAPLQQMAEAVNATVLEVAQRKHKRVSAA